MTTVFGSARPCSLAARFGVSKTTDCSCADPSPIRSPTTTRPVAIPTRACSVTELTSRRPTTSTIPNPARTARSASSLVCTRIAEIDEDAVAHVLGNEAVERGDSFADRAMIGSNDLAEILGIEPRRERGRADQIAEHHRQLSAFGFGAHRRRRQRGGRRLSPERGDGVEQPPAAADRADAEFAQILA